VESNISLKPTLSPAITGVDPSTGKYFKTNAERIAYFKRTRVSGDRIFGNRKNDATRIQPQTSMVPESGGALVKTGGDSNLSSTVENIQKALSALQDTVKKISDSLLEEKKKKQEQEDKQKRSAKIAEEKDKASEEENLLEKTPDSLKNKLLAPMKAAGKAMGGILQKLKDAFMLIFAGFLFDKGLKAIKAFMDGDYKAFAGFALSIVSTLGIAGGIMLALSGGLGAIPALITPIASMLATVGTAIIGFLLSPPGLITLAVIAGIGAAVMGANAIRTAMAGGKEFRDAHKKNNERLKDLKNMGVTSGGKIEIDGKNVDVMEHGTEEQKAAYMEFKKERDRLDGIRDAMNKEINETHDKWWKQVRETSPKSGVERQQHWADARVKWAETKENIRAKYEAKISGGGYSGSSEPVSEVSDSNVQSPPKSETKITKVTSQTNLDPVADSKPEIVYKKSFAQQDGGKAPGADSNQTEAPSIASSNPSNFLTLYSQMNYNTVT
jgi:hypothetical protein